MIYIWLILLIINILFATKINYSPIKPDGTFYIIFGLFIITVTSYFLIAFLYNRKIKTGFKIKIYSLDKLENNEFKNNLASIALFAYLYGILAYIIYFYRLNSLINIKNITNNLWLWKYYELSGILTRSILLQLGMHSAIIIILLTLNYQFNKTRVSIIYLITYLLFSLICPRRDPIVDVFGAFIGIQSLYSKKRAILKIAIIYILIILMFIYIDYKINTKSELNLENLFNYTSGNFSAFQQILDQGVVFESRFKYQNTFYFIFSLLKFIDKDLTPPNVIKPQPIYGEYNIPNTYTAFGDPVYEGGIFGLLIYSIFVGFIMGFICFYKKYYNTPSSFILYGTLFSVSIRSFINNTFGWTQIYFAALVGILLDLLILKRKLK